MPSVNGQEYQHALLKVNFAVGDSPQIKTLRKMSFKASSPKEAVSDYQGQPIGWVQKKLENTGSFSLLRSEWLVVKKKILDANKQPVQLGILQCRLDWTLVYGNSFVTYQTVKLNGVMFNEDGFESQDTQDPLVIEIPLFILGSKDENDIAPVVYL